MNDDTNPWDLREFGYLLRQARQHRRLRQQDLAALSGVGTRTIGDLERGKCVPSVCTVERLRLALDVDVTDLWPSGQWAAAWAEHVQRFGGDNE